jgi:hypothetical protein
MTEHEGRTETRPQAPQGEQKGLALDVAKEAVAYGTVEAGKVVAGRIIDHFRPTAEPPDAPPPSAPSEGYGAADTAPDWNWPSS